MSPELSIAGHTFTLPIHCPSCGGVLVWTAKRYRPQQEFGAN